MTTSTCLSSRSPLISVGTIALYAVILCVAGVGRPALGQQNETAAPGGQMNSDVQNMGCSGPDLCGQQDQTGSSLPNAPSAYPRSPAKVGSLTFGDRARIYKQALIRPYTLLGPALGAGIGQWEDEPPEWGPASDGYARRFASGVGRSVIAETIRFGFAAADGEDPRYHRSQESGVWNRARHVIAETFTSETVTELVFRLTLASPVSMARPSSPMRGIQNPGPPRAMHSNAVQPPLLPAWGSICSRNLSRGSTLRRFISGISRMACRATASAYEFTFNSSRGDDSGKLN